MKQEELGVSYVAKLFTVSGDMVKKWNWLFAEFLSSSANPRKGQPRIYTSEDIRVFALVADYHDWNAPDEDNNYSDIFSALNSGRAYAL